MSAPAPGPVATAVRALARTPAAAARYDLTPRAAVLCSILTLAAVTGLDLLDGTIGAAFDVAFVLVVLTAATAVQARGLFTVGVLPPFLMIGALLTLALTVPDALVVDGLPDSAGVFGRTLGATISHGVVLLVGHALAIGAIVLRFATTAPQPSRA